MKTLLRTLSLFTMTFVTLCNAQNTKKNILFIAVDDLKPLLSNYGVSEMITPNFDRLAKMGMTFTNAHVQYAVCGPSRASIMTGVNPDRTKVWDLHTDFRKSAPNLMSMPEYLITQGYQTTAVGKIYHQGATSTSPGHDAKSWSIPHQSPENYDSKYGRPAFNYYQNPETKRQLEKIEKEARKKGITKSGKIRNYVLERLKPTTESMDIPDNAYPDGLYTETALKQLNDLEKNGKPWFLGVGFQRPHLPFSAPKKYWDLYDRDKVKLAEFQQLGEGIPEIAYHPFGELKSYSDIDNDFNIGNKIPEAKQRELIHGYMAATSYIDALLGKLLDELEKRNIIDNTVIVLWGDHGWHLGDHTEWCKHSNFEQATRIPFMFAGPGVERNKKNNDPVNLVDLFPTVFELANVKQSSQTDGESLVPLLDNNASTNLNIDYAYHQYARGGTKMGYSIRTAQYRYTEWHANNYRSYDAYNEKNIIARELYDYDKDPLETKNWVDDKAYSSIAKDLKNKLKSHLTK